MRQGDYDELTSLSTSIYWLKAVIYQGARIFEAASQPTEHLNSHIYNSQFNSRKMMEEQFFLTACGKAQRWISPMNLETPDAQRFSKLGETIKKVRDEREHDEERYGLGKKFDLDDLDPGEHAEKGFVRDPTKRDKFRMEKADTDGGVTIFGTMSTTVHSGGRVLLGGIVDVAKVVSAAEALIEPLLEKQHAYWKQWIARRPRSNEKKARMGRSFYIEPRF